MDLYIAISTGLVSLLTGIIEYQKVGSRAICVRGFCFPELAELSFACGCAAQLEATIVSLNASSVSLSHLLLWWDCLTFVEKRMGRHKNMLVSTTESAIMGEVNLFYPHGDPHDTEKEEQE